MKSKEAKVEAVIHIFQVCVHMCVHMGNVIFSTSACSNFAYRVYYHSQ